MILKSGGRIVCPPLTFNFSTSFDNEEIIPYSLLYNGVIGCLGGQS